MALGSQFKILRQQSQALITTIQPHRIWEISIFQPFLTSFSQTSFVLEKVHRFYHLHDNGSCNNGAAFALSGRTLQHLKRLEIEGHVHLVGNRYYEISFPIKETKGLLQNLKRLTHFLLMRNHILEQHL